MTRPVTVLQGKSTSASICDEALSRRCTGAKARYHWCSTSPLSSPARLCL